MPSESSPTYSYDELPYASYPYAHSHPRNLAALAQLFGMTAADVNCCRVLEIGCAAGGNLIPMALNLPQGKFLGLDASGRQITQGQEVIESLSLSNVELIHQDIMDLAPDCGEFDFIICHGVYSWVPPEVQSKILSVCHNHLSENGVAYISYNTYPGWYLRRGVREMMSYHATGFTDTQDKINQSRALVDFLAGAVQPSSDAYERLLHEELRILRSSEDSYIFHEHLEDHNEPLFFHQFVSRAKENELRFLCEAQFGSMFASDYSDETREVLAKIAPDIIQMEQYTDFLRNRKFRQTLICHRQIELDRVVTPARLKGLFVGAPIKPRDMPDGETGGAMVFDHASGPHFTVSNPVQKFALTYLANHWPADIQIEALAEIARDELPAQDRPSLETCCQELYETFLELYSASLVSLFATPSNCVPDAPDRPQANPLVRHQASLGNAVTNQLHQTVRLDNFERDIVSRLDGQHTIDELAQKLMENSVSVEQDDEVGATEQVKPNQEQFRDAVAHHLKRIAHTALLVDSSTADSKVLPN